MDQYKFVKSQMGKDKLAFKGHIYRHQRSRSTNHYFRCEDKNCNGSATLRGVAFFNALGGSVSEGKTHNHTVLTSRVEIVEVVEAIKNMAKTSTSAPAAIVQNVRQDLGIYNAIEMPSKTALRQVVHCIRKKELPVEPECVTDLIIPNNLRVTQAGEQNFLLFDTQNEVGKRIIAFSTEENLRRLRDSEIWFLDGTFKTCPRLFHQLYTIHFMFHGNVFPGVYVFMTGKTQEMYTSMLERLVSSAEAKGITLNPTFIILDFELASINALQRTFPDERLSGCLFHLGQNIYRNIQKNGLVDAYKTIDNVSLSLRKLSALACLPSEEIYDAFIAISENIPNEVEAVYKYFGETYVLGRPNIVRGRGRPRRAPILHPPRFPPTLWSIYHLQGYNLPRTNNNLEAWHRRFETVVQRYHLGVYSMIKEFIKENHHTEQEIERLIAGSCTRKKKKEQVQREERIATVMSRHGTVPVDEYLRGIAHNMHFSSCNNEDDGEQEF